MEILLFGDQQADCQLFLRHVFHLKGNPILTSLLDRVGSALRDEISRQPNRYHHKRIPRFSTVRELVERHYTSGQPNPAIESAIICLAQLSHFICYIDEQPGGYLRPSSSSSPGPQLLGACTGLVAASAIASAGSLTTLLPLAVEAVRIAFRIGSYVGDVAQRVGGPHDVLESWSTLVAVSDKKAAETALDDYNQEYGNALSNRMWISAYSPNVITVSGPPSKRKRLLEKSAFYSRTQHVDIGVYGPYHAEHVHSAADISEILGPDTREVFSQSSIHYPVYSGVTAKPITASSPVDLLEECVGEILRKPLRWDRLSKECASGSLAPLDAKCTIYSIGPSELTDSLIHTVKSMGNVQIATEDAKKWLSNHSSNPSGTGKSTGSDIAIVGMAGRFPDAADVEKFWELLEKGLDVHREVPKDRYNVKTHTDVTSRKKNTSHTPYGNFIESPGSFDARFFNMSPREAAQTDPMQRLELATAYEAMEMAGIVPGRSPSTKHDRIGTFYGMTSDDWREINAAQNIDTYYISGGVRAFGAGRINYFFKFSGPSFVVDTACSSSFAAIQLACTSLRAGDCDTAFTGGANVLTNPDIFSGLSRGHFLSKTGNCKTFDNDADGYCRGDGVATVILKRVEDALSDKDPILGVIRASATNHSAEAVSITHPHVGAQKFLFDKVLRASNTNAHDVSYVEMHGTGTQAGDAVEMESVSSIFAPGQHRRSPDQPLYLGSVKSNIGHGEAVSGVCALIKVLLMLQRNTIPPHCGIKTVINKNFPKDLKERGVNIALQKTPFLRPVGGKRIVFINNFSAAGGNTALLLEDGPEKTPLEVTDPRSFHVVTVSAKSLASFKKNIERLQTYLDQNPNTDLASVSYTTTARRLHHNYRAAFSVSQMQQAKAALSKVKDESHSPISSETPRIAFAFTGQGSQYTEMGRKLFETCKHFRSEIQYFDRLAGCQGFPSFMPLIDGSVTDGKTLSAVVTQLGMVCVQMALVHLWTSWGLKPSVVVGHSLGEYAALYAAGVLSAADTIFLVGSRAQELEKGCTRGTHAMLAVKGSASAVVKAISGSNVEIACINSEAETVVSGTTSEIEAVSGKLRTHNLDSKKLNIPFAFHSSQVDPILEPFQAAANAATFHAPETPVISPLLNKIVREEGVFSAGYLSRHCREAVNFQGGLRTALDQSVIDEKTLWIEVGAHPICAGMVKSCISSSALTAPSLKRGEDPWKTITTSLCALYLAGVNLDWAAYHRDFELFVEHVPLPIYSYDEKIYWLQYVNEWTLTKGDPVASTPAIEEPPKLSTTSIHRIIREEVQSVRATVVAESDLANPLLYKAVAGHSVNGTGLGPSSLYADMALTLTKYAYNILRPDEKQVDMNVRNMENPAPLLVKNLKEPQHQTVQTESAIDLNTDEAVVTISSVAANSKTKTVHAKCLVAIEDASTWASGWQRNAFLVRARLDFLEEKVKAGKAHRLLRGMVYKLFASLVDYSEKYQGMKEVVLDTSNLEASAQIEFQADSQDGNFYLSPYHIDSIGHLAGFIMNGNDGLDSKNQVFISHGWESMRLPTTMQAGKTYYSWVKMQPHSSGEKTFAGDVYLFDDSDKIIGVIEGLKFQCIPRQLLNTFIPPVKAGATQASSPQKVQAQQKPAPAPKAVSKPAKQKTIKVESAKKPTSGASKADQAIRIIADEVGVDLGELADNIVFADIGVDSLMSLTISGRFREELQLDVESTLFTDCPTVGSLKTSLSLQASTDVNPSEDESSDESDLPASTGMTTPEKANTPPKASGASTADDNDIITMIRTTIAEQMDISVEEITDTTDLSTIGMDSLMSLNILGIIGEKTGESFEPSLLANNTSIAALRKALGVDAAPAPKKVEEAPRTSKASEEPREDPNRKATSVLLQGHPRSATRKLFLFPDGSGSATSYTTIPPISPNELAVYGLNCPFLKDPTSFKCGVVGVTKMYIDEMLRRQPEGPYLIGGWSAGGVFAFEATRQLSAMKKANPNKNYDVEKLLLLDSPCPYALEPLPTRLHVFFNEIGLLGDGNPANTPKWLLPHFQASIDALKQYQPVLIRDEPFDAPKTYLIWCTDGVCKNPGDPRPPPQDDDPKSMKWLLNNRTDFSPNGWDKLLGSENCTCTTISGNHFTMMKEPIASDLQRKIKEGLNM